MKSSSLIVFIPIAAIVGLLSSPLAARAAMIDASGVLGQGGSFTTDTVDYPSGSVNSRGFGGLSSVALDTVNHRLFVSDNVNSRVLVFPLDSDNDISTDTPSYVFGACGYDSAGATSTTASTFEGGSPYNYINLAYDSADERLFVSVYAQHRVLAFDASPSALAAAGNCEQASFVLGSTEFNGLTGTTTANSITPDDIAYDAADHRLFVSDDGSGSPNGQVMAFDVPSDATSSINGEDAIFHLGYTVIYIGVTYIVSHQLHLPTGIAYDPINHRLFVSDFAQNRVLAYSVPADATSSIDNELNSFVIGQTNNINTAATTTQSGLSAPDDLSYDSANNRLFVSDHNNNRIMIFSVPDDATSSFDGANAENVINQPDWTSSASGTAQNAMSYPEAAADAYDEADNTLYSYELYGARVMEIPMIHITTASLADATVGQPYSQTIHTASEQGSSQSFSVYSGSLPAGLSLDTSTGVISGTPTAAGSSVFTIEADDDFPTGPMFDRQAYTIDTAAAPSQQASPSPASVSSSGGSISLSQLASILAPSASSTAYLRSRGYDGVSPSPAVVAESSSTPVPGCPEGYTCIPIVGGAGSSAIFSRDLTVGSIGADVKSLQEYLDAHGFVLASSGPGSPGNETDYFGPLTRAALARFQAADGINPAVGLFGPITRGYIASHD